MPNFTLSVGGYAASLVSANVKDLNNNGTVSGMTSLNENNFRRFDYGLACGFSIDIQHVTFGESYNYGLQSIGKPGGLSSYMTTNSRNSVSTLFVGFSF